MERRLILLSLLVFMLSSCAQNGFQEPLASVKDAPATTTYSPPAPVGKMIGNHRVVEGASQVSGLKLNIYGPQNASTALKGTVTFQPADGSPIAVPFEVSGTINFADYTSFMRATNQAQLEAMNLQVGAKLTCLTTDCNESFIDIYINYKGIVYHHQVEAKGNEISQAADVAKSNSGKEASTTTPPTSNTDSSGKKSPKEDLPVKDHQPESPMTSKIPKAPVEEATGKDDDGSQPENDIDEDTEGGTYVGEPQKDLEVLFPDSIAKEDQNTGKNTGKNTDKNGDQARGQIKDPTNDGKKPNILPTKNSEGSGLFGVIMKGLGQAVTAVGGKNFIKGHLENPANVLAYEEKNPKAGFHIINPKRQNYYGTDDMLAVLTYMGRYSQEQLKGYILNIGDVSAKRGGPLGNHSSHQMGLDADISYYFDAKEKQKGLAVAVASSKPIPSFMADEEWDLFKALVSQGNVDRIFIHPVLKKELCGIASRKGDLNSSGTDGSAFEVLRVMRPEVHHNNHFHLRLKCSTAQPRCRQMAPPPKETGC